MRKADEIHHRAVEDKYSFRNTTRISLQPPEYRKSNWNGKQRENRFPTHGVRQGVGFRKAHGWM